MHHLDTSTGKSQKILFTGGVMKLSLVVSKVHRSLWLFKPRKKYDAAQSSTSTELRVLMDLDLYASDNIGKAQFEKVY